MIVPISQDFVEETQEIWGRRLGRPVSRDEAEQMIHTVGDFFDVLIRWDRESRTGREDTSDGAENEGRTTDDEGSGRR